jgi:hypothetical protein
VRATIQLPRDRLRKIDREWDAMHAQRAVVSELVQGSTGVRDEMIALRNHIVETARSYRSGEDLVPEKVAEAIFPAAELQRQQQQQRARSLQPQSGAHLRRCPDGHKGGREHPDQQTV